MKLTYFDCRGRAEPIELLLVDANVDFEREVVTREEWRKLQSSGQAGPPAFPFERLPILKFEHGARGGNDSVLAETSAIIHFLQRKLAPPKQAPSPPDASARLEMILSSSLALLNKILDLASGNPDQPTDWLAPPTRTDLFATWVLPYLNSLEHHLSSTFFPPLLTPPPSTTSGQPGTTLSGAAATAAVVLDLLADLFPSLAGRSDALPAGLKPGGGLKEVDGLLKGEVPAEAKGLEVRWPKCEGLRLAVMERPRVRAWREGGRRQEEWFAYASGEDIGAAAEKYKEEDEEVVKKAGL